MVCGIGLLIVDVVGDMNGLCIGMLELVCWGMIVVDVECFIGLIKCGLFDVFV